MTKIKTENISGAVNDNIPSSYKVNTGNETVIEYVEDDIAGIPGSDFAKAATRVFDEIDIGKDGVLPSSIFFTWLKHLGGGGSC